VVLKLATEYDLHTLDVCSNRLSAAALAPLWEIHERLGLWVECGE